MGSTPSLSTEMYILANVPNSQGLLSEQCYALVTGRASGHLPPNFQGGPQFAVSIYLEDVSLSAISGL